MTRQYGSQSMAGPLKRVLMRRAASAMRGADAGRWHYGPGFNPARAAAQHDALTALVEASGAELAWLTDEMRQRGLILRNDSRNDPTTQLCPPLVITREECDRTVAILDDTITELGRRLGSVGTRHASAAV